MARTRVLTRDSASPSQRHFSTPLVHSRRQHLDCRSLSQHNVGAVARGGTATRRPAGDKAKLKIERDLHSQHSAVSAANLTLLGIELAILPGGVSTTCYSPPCLAQLWLWLLPFSALWRCRPRRRAWQRSRSTPWRGNASSLWATGASTCAQYSREKMKAGSLGSSGLHRPQ